MSFLNRLKQDVSGSFDRRHVLVEPDDCQRDDGHHRRQDVDGQVLVPEHDDADGEGRQAAADAEDLGHVGRWRHLWKTISGYRIKSDITGGSIAQGSTFALLDTAASGLIPGIPDNFPSNCRCCCSVQRLNNVDRIHLVLACGI